MSQCEGELPAQPLKTMSKIANKKPQKLFKFRFLTETNLHTVRREQVYIYILTLHKKIRTLLRKCKRYREKIRKLVSCMEDVLCGLEPEIKLNLLFSGKSVAFVITREREARNR